jgi:hypothetical protein
MIRFGQINKINKIKNFQDKYLIYIAKSWNLWSINCPCIYKKNPLSKDPLSKTMNKGVNNS